MIEKKLDEFRRKLLDLSRRNRLLNFSCEGNRSVALVNASPSEIFRHLVADRECVHLLATDETGAGGSHGLVDVHHCSEKEVSTCDKTCQGQRNGHDRSRRGETRNEVRTSDSEEKLGTKLLRIAREAESALQEQGCNILFATVGLLEWNDVNGQQKNCFAPLLLVPVELRRDHVRDRHRVFPFDDDPIVNPALAELGRRDFQIAFPELDVAGDDPAGTYLERVERIAGGIDGWSVRREVHIGLFSFAKLLMYQDLDPRVWPPGESVLDHPLVQTLCGMPNTGSSQASMPCLPEELDAKCSPHDCFQVLDADSSQQAAIVAAKEGRNMVIVGPPGTGKSQTITNIIAECLSARKTVLFVAEKAAALDVVKSRLEKTGLGDFVLALHSRKTAKRVVLNELEKALRVLAPTTGQADIGTEELERTRRELNKHARLLHHRTTPMNMSLFEAMGKCAELRTAPKAVVQLENVSQWDRQRLADTRAQVSRLASTASRIGDPQKHPWRGVGLRRLTLEVEQHLPSVLDQLQRAVSEVDAAGAALADLLGSATPRHLADTSRLAEMATTVDDACDLPKPMLDESTLTALPADITQLIQLGRRTDQLRQELTGIWDLSEETVDWGAVHRRYQESLQSWFPWLRASWWHDARTVRRHRVDARRPDPDTLERELPLLAELGETCLQIGRKEQLAAGFFGALWQGQHSNWDRLATSVDTAVRLRQDLLHGGASREAVSQLLHGTDRNRLRALLRHLVSARNQFLKVRKRLTDLLDMERSFYPGLDCASVPWSEWSNRLEICTHRRERLLEWIDYTRELASCQKIGLSTFLSWADKQRAKVSPETWADALTRLFYRSWVDEAFRSMPEFGAYRGEELERLAEQFSEHDRRWTELSRERLAARLSHRRDECESSPAKRGMINKLEAEFRLRRNNRPIRKLFADTAEVVQDLKPCFMMSPISVAQFLQPGKLKFDVVIFDEASQVEPADAIGAVARAKQLILVGDEKQLPPTNFFHTVGASEEQEQDEDDCLAVGELESVLGVGQVCLPVKTTLRWHYRSRHASLIEFSNEHFYDRQLRVFSSPVSERDSQGVGFRYVPDGCYLRGKGQYNRPEAVCVAEAVLEHARKRPNLSLGVGAFNKSQQKAIEDELERRRRELNDADVEAFFDRNLEAPFFVKNLETIQGDERDVIMLSVGYGPDQNNHVTMNFGPLNKDGGWRRLNVLITRARLQCLVFSSLTADRLKLEPGSPRGVQALKAYLHFAQHGALPKVEGHRADHDSPFEADVCRELVDAGWEVHAQVGCAGFAIDLAVVDPRAPGRYLLGIECDGATYHSAATARDRDRLRQNVLEGLGWNIYRIWSTDWFHRRQATKELLLEGVRRVSENSPPVSNVRLTSDDRYEQASRESERTSSPHLRSPQIIEETSLRRDVEQSLSICEHVVQDALRATLIEDVSHDVSDTALPEVPTNRCEDSLSAAPINEVTDLLARMLMERGAMAVDELFLSVADSRQDRLTPDVRERLTSALDLLERMERVTTLSQVVSLHPAFAGSID